MDDSAFTVNNQATSRRIAQSNHTVPNAGQKDTYQQNALLNNRATDHLMMDTNFERKQGTKTVRLTEKNGKDHRINLNSHIKTTDVSIAPVITKHQAPTISNHARGTGIYQNLNQFSNISPQHSSPSQQPSQQSQSTVGVTTPTLTVNNPQFQQGF